MAKKVEISSDLVKKNVAALQSFMQEKSLESFYVSSFDEFLNEYVPMSDCHRFYFTGFSGSVAEVLVPQSGKVKLYVDGRYHEQADLEVDASIVEVVKVGQNQSLAKALLEDVKSANPKNIAIEAKRTSMKHYNDLLNLVDEVICLNDELNDVVDFSAKDKLAPVKFVSKEFRGDDTDKKLERIFKDDNTAYFVTAIDSIAWLTNCRGYHLPNMSSFLGRALVTREKVFVFVEPSIELDASIADVTKTEFIKVNTSELEKTLEYIKLNNDFENIYIEPGMLNAGLYNTLVNVFGKDSLVEKAGGLVWFHSIKEESEMVEIRRSFNQADKAIFNTINWVKNSLKDNKAISEYDLYTQTTVEYEKQGSVEQSFNTIAGVGPNGSIIHYGDPKKDIMIKEDDMVLLDSGGYFDGGFATDTTRTFMGSDKEPTQRHKKIYTLVLKGLLQCQNAKFPKNTAGIVLDGFARKPIYDEGMNYLHGTGHGVGIHVHEGGVRIGASQLPMKEGQVVSIEPGIYIPGFGGVRLENIAYVKESKDNSDFLEFESLVYIGFEPSLIDESMLTGQEKTWLEEYEVKCKELGRSFR